MEEKPKKIGTVMASLLVYVAICLDLIQFGVAFIPAVGEVLPPIIAIGTGLIFFIWFKIIGVKIGIMKSPKKFMGVLTTSVVEFIPILSALPGWTIFVVMTIISVNANVNIPFVSPEKPSASKTIKIPEATK
jgi:hypothetical protein